MLGCGFSSSSWTAPVTKSTLTKVHLSATPGRIDLCVATVMAANMFPASPSPMYPSVTGVINQPDSRTDATWY